MMKYHKISTVVTCSRCSCEDEWTEVTPDYLKWEWSELSQGSNEDGCQKIVFDLCPACTREVKAWIRNGR